VLFLVSVVIFSLIHLTPGDPVQAMLGVEASQEDIQRVRRELGLDQPLYVQYATWLGRVVRGDLGHSIRTHQPVMEAIVQRLPVTVEISLVAMTVALLISIPAGTVSAVRRNSTADATSRVLSLLGVSVPNFFLAILLIYVFSLKLRWLPPIGFVPLWDDPLGNLKSVVMPAITLGTAVAAIVTRQMRSSLLEVLSQDYIRTAWAKGLAARIVLRHHALRNALMPVITVIGLEFAFLIGGLVVTEQVFNLNGIGKLIVDAIAQRDYTLIQGLLLLVAVAYMLVNFLVDILYAWIDPRVAYQ
jgi:peptide/nickel transport system permease protein